jgi:hypothetical protein
MQAGTTPHQDNPRNCASVTAPTRNVPDVQYPRLGESHRTAVPRKATRRWHTRTSGPKTTPTTRPIRRSRWSAIHSSQWCRFDPRISSLSVLRLSFAGASTRSSVLLLQFLTRGRRAGRANCIVPCQGRYLVEQGSDVHECNGRCDIRRLAGAIANRIRAAGRGMVGAGPDCGAGSTDPLGVRRGDDQDLCSSHCDGAVFIRAGNSGADWLVDPSSAVPLARGAGIWLGVGGWWYWRSRLRDTR